MAAMAPLRAKWMKLGQKGMGPGARSSHAATVIGDKLYAFGGELEPRIPVDNKLHVFDLNDLTWSVAVAGGEVPPPCIGVTMAAVGGTVYVFGGRDAARNELNELYAFDTAANLWHLVSSGDVGPCRRSYHSMTSDDRRVYVFGGCGESGRLNDLWAFDSIDRRWNKFPSPGDGCSGRGGPGLAAVDGKIWVVYGFSGVELGDVHCFRPMENEWQQVDARGEKPTPRSVFCTAGIGKYVYVYGGEIDPSDQGHMGAGKFSGETHALNTETNTWTRVEDEVDPGQHPGPRGWCAFSRAIRDGDEGLVVYGGNSPSNDRLADIFFCSLLTC